MAVYGEGSGHISRGIILDNGHILRILSNGVTVIFSLHDTTDKTINCEIGFSDAACTVEVISFRVSDNALTRDRQRDLHIGHDMPLPVDSGPFEFIAADCVASGLIIANLRLSEITLPGGSSGASIGGEVTVNSGPHVSSTPIVTVSQNAIAACVTNPPSIADDRPNSIAKSITINDGGIEYVFSAAPDGQAVQRQDRFLISLSDGTTITVVNFRPSDHESFR